MSKIKQAIWDKIEDGVDVIEETEKEQTEE
jgi:hypothetical protein